MSKHKQHEKMAIFAFLITVLIAAAAFYYLWQVQVQYGRTIEGTQALGEIMLKRQLAQEMLTKPQAAAVQDFSAREGCCIFVENLALGSQIKIDVPRGSSGLCSDNIDEYTQRNIKNGKSLLVDIEAGECAKQIVT